MPHLTSASLALTLALLVTEPAFVDPFKALIKVGVARAGVGGGRAGGLEGGGRERARPNARLTTRPPTDPTRVAQVLPLVVDEAHSATVAALVALALRTTTAGVDAASVATIEVASTATRRQIAPDLDEFRGSFG